MNRVRSVLLALLLVLLSACGGAKPDPDPGAARWDSARWDRSNWQP